MVLKNTICKHSGTGKKTGKKTTTNHGSAVEITDASLESSVFGKQVLGAAPLVLVKVNARHLLLAVGASDHHVNTVLLFVVLVLAKVVGAAGALVANKLQNGVDKRRTARFPVVKRGGLVADGALGHVGGAVLADVVAASDRREDRKASRAQAHEALELLEHRALKARLGAPRQLGWGGSRRRGHVRRKMTDLSADYPFVIKNGGKNQKVWTRSARIQF